MMRTFIGVILLAGLSSQALAGKLTITGNNGPVTVSGSTYSGVVNKGVINGGSGTGLTVSGTASRSVTNNGTITGTTGIKVTGSGSSTIVNNGTITAKSTGGSSARAVGISQTVAP